MRVLIGVDGAKRNRRPQASKGNEAGPCIPKLFGHFRRRNPKGITPQSPGLRRGSYPGKSLVQVTTPTGLRLDLKPIFHPHSTWCLGRSAWSQSRRGCKVVRAFTQSSACRATLNLVEGSLWDTKPDALSKRSRSSATCKNRPPLPVPLLPPREAREKPLPTSGCTTRG